MQKCDGCHKPAWACAECLKEGELPSTPSELIQQGRELCDLISDGPWYNKCGYVEDQKGVMVCSVMSTRGKFQEENENAAFIAASRTIVPQLCDALEAAQKEIERLNGDYDEANRAYHEWFEEAQKATARAEKAEAERDTANKCIRDTETYFDLGTNKFAYRTIKQYTYDVMEAQCTES